MSIDPVTEQFCTELLLRGYTPEAVTVELQKQAFDSPFCKEYQATLYKLVTEILPELHQKEAMAALGRLGLGAGRMALSAGKRLLRPRNLALGAAGGTGLWAAGTQLSPGGKYRPTPPNQTWVSPDAMGAYSGAKPPSTNTPAGGSMPSLFIRPSPSQVMPGGGTQNGGGTKPGQFGMAADLNQLALRRSDVTKRLGELDAQINAAPMSSEKLLLTRKRQGLLSERAALESQFASQYPEYQQNQQRMTSSVGNQINDLNSRLKQQTGQQEKLTGSLLEGEAAETPTAMMMGWWNKLTGKEDKLRTMEQNMVEQRRRLAEAEAWSKTLTNGYAL